MNSRRDHVGIEIADMRTQDSDASPTFQKLKYKKWKGLLRTMDLSFCHTLFYVLN